MISHLFLTDPPNMMLVSVASGFSLEIKWNCSRMSSLDFVLQLLGSVYHRASEHLIAAQKGKFYIGGGGGRCSQLTADLW